jgi:hypothetical protein
VEFHGHTTYEITKRIILKGGSHNPLEDMRRVFDALKESTFVDILVFQKFKFSEVEESEPQQQELRNLKS